MLSSCALFTILSDSVSQHQFVQKRRDYAWLEVDSFFIVFVFNPAYKQDLDTFMEKLN